MRSQFPGYFRPSSSELKEMMGKSIISVDANVLLNLYRYSPDTRKSLEVSLGSLSQNLFLTHQVAEEFLRNRLTVLSKQAAEYDAVISEIRKFSNNITDSSRHPFIDSADIGPFSSIVEKILAGFETKKENLINCFVDDDTLNFVADLFQGKTGEAFTGDSIESLSKEGEDRFSKKIPPGYMDKNKEVQGDVQRKYGDLFVWKQLILQSKLLSKSLIFISDDKKEDWWQEERGRTIGPRVELCEEFYRETGSRFWMYNTHQFLEHVSEGNKKIHVQKNALDEIKKISESVSNINKESSQLKYIYKSLDKYLSKEDKNIFDYTSMIHYIQDYKSSDDKRDDPSIEFLLDRLRDRLERITNKEAEEVSSRRRYLVLSEDEILVQLMKYIENNPSSDNGVGLRQFVVDFLGRQGIEINHTYARLNDMSKRGIVEIYEIISETGGKSTRIRMPQ